MQTVAMCLLLGACSSGGSGTDEILPPSESEPEKPLPIALDCSSTGYAVARATDDGFEAGDAVGVFVVNYDQGQAGALHLPATMCTTAFQLWRFLDVLTNRFIGRTIGPRRTFMYTILIGRRFLCMT